MSNRQWLVLTLTVAALVGMIFCADAVLLDRKVDQIGSAPMSPIGPFVQERPNRAAWPRIVTVGCAQRITKDLENEVEERLATAPGSL